MVRPSRLRRLRIQRALQVAVLATGTLLVGTALSLAWHKNVTLVVAGTPQSVRTTSSNVGDLLRSEGVPLTLGLQVQPPPGTAHPQVNGRARPAPARKIAVFRSSAAD